MGKKRRDGRASKRGNNSASSNGARNSGGGGSGTICYNDGIYNGELRGGKPHGKGRIGWEDGESYEGDWRAGAMHGRGRIAYESGDVYVGEVESDKRHGTGTLRWANGNIYDGQWKEGKQHGQGNLTLTNGAFYYGQWKGGKHHGEGTHKWADGRVYEGQFANGQMHGRGTKTWPSGNVYEGEWAEGEEHGKGTLKLPTGEICEGVWVHGELAHKDITNHSPPGCSATGESSLPREHHNERTPRSQRSQRRRLEAATKNCDHCGVDDYHYKLQVCSGCNLALYCSAACQQAASRSHRRICDIISMLPSIGSDRMPLAYDREKMVDLDAGLRYATKYMGNLKHLQINVKAMDKDDTVKLSVKRLSSLLRSKEGKLDSFSWLSGGDEVHGILEANAVRRELRGLKQLLLEYVRFNDVLPLHEIIGHQEDTLEVLCLPFLDIGWHKAKNRRAMAQAVSVCKHLVHLDLRECVLVDSDLKVMLHDLPNLRILRLTRRIDGSHDFTDNTCGLIARKCPSLQELNLRNHNQLSVRGVRKIFEGCPHLRCFFTTAHKLSCSDIRSLLEIAPQMLHLSLRGRLSDKVGLSVGELDELIEATGGRTVLQLRMGSVFEPDNVSVNTRERYEQQKGVLSDIWSRWGDPEVANEWAGIFGG